MLDALGHRYGILPSTIMGMPEGTGTSLLFNIKVMGMAMEAQEEDGTLSEQIKRNQMNWPPEVKRELREKGLWR